jgi:uncharacterized protein (TIGR03083 family)
MADSTGTWSMIHAERASLAETIAALTPEQWGTPSLCAGWTAGQVAAHLLASAEQTPGHFLAGMVSTGLRFHALMARDVRRRAGLSPTQVADGLRHRTTTTNRPPAPVAAMLGEVVVHGEDLRRPLGLHREVPAGAVNACLALFAKAGFPVGGKSRIAGLRLTSTDTGWSYGSGPEVTGPGMSLLLAMTGRPAGLPHLRGEGSPVLVRRVSGTPTAG